MGDQLHSINNVNFDVSKLPMDEPIGQPRSSPVTPESKKKYNTPSLTWT